MLEHDGWSKQEYHRRSVTDKQRILDEQSKARLSSFTLKKYLLCSESYEVNLMK